MIVAIPIHIVAVVVWLGGLFLLTVVLPPSTRRMDSMTSAQLWHRVLSRFFVWGTAGAVIIVASGIALVQVRFGGFSEMPALHRWNMAIGIPAILLYGYALLVPWQRCRRAIARADWSTAEESTARIRTLLGIVLTLGLVASVVSGAGRIALQPS